MRNQRDPKFYTKFDAKGLVAMIYVYVDDLIIIENSLKLIDEIKVQMSQVSKMKYFCELHYCLCLEVWRDVGYTFVI